MKWIAWAIALSMPRSAGWGFFAFGAAFGAGAGAAVAGSAARATGTWQTIDRAARRVSNEAELEVGNAVLRVTVGGSAVAASPTRLDVQFLDFEVALEPTPLRLALPLSLLAPRGAVETTYLDGEVRIGRGDKGSVFVCARAGSAEAA